MQQRRHYYSKPSQMYSRQMLPYYYMSSQIYSGKLMPTVRRMFVDPQIFPYYNLKPIPFIRRNAWESSRQINELPGASLVVMYQS